jgi:hypothetical protein
VQYPRSLGKTLPDSTANLSVPNLARVLIRLRDPDIRGSVTVVHAARPGEGELALSIASARLKHGGIKVAGPEPSTVFDLIEYGARIGATVIFAGELRRAEDGRALRAAAKVGIKAVGIVTSESFAEAQLMVRALGPWDGCDIDFFSIAPP